MPATMTSRFVFAPARSAGAVNPLSSVRRSIIREVLWNGNREPWSNLYSLDPDKSVIAWAWVKHPERRALYNHTIDDPRWKHLTWTRFTSRKAAVRWLDAI